jgi:glycosyltransferase 2 family protein
VRSAGLGRVAVTDLAAPRATPVPRQTGQTSRPAASLPRRLWVWLRPLLGLALLAALVWRLGTGAFVEGLRVIDLWSVLAALGLGMLTTVAGAWRWCIVARRLGLPLSLRLAVADCYRAILLNSVLPVGVLGDVHRAVNHGHQSGDLGRGVRAVVLERAAGQMVLIATGVGVLLAYPGIVSALTTAAAPGVWTAGAVLGVVGVLVGVAVWLRRSSVDSAWRRAARTALTDTRLGLFSRDTAPAVLLLSVVALAGHICMFLVAARAAHSSLPVATLLPFVVLALLVMGLPVNVGGWGPREAFLALAFGAVGLGAGQGLAIAVAYGVLTLVACLPGAVVLLFRRRRPSREPLPDLS